MESTCVEAPRRSYGNTGIPWPRILEMRRSRFARSSASAHSKPNRGGWVGSMSAVHPRPGSAGRGRAGGPGRGTARRRAVQRVEGSVQGGEREEVGVPREAAGSESSGVARSKTPPCARR